MAEQVKYNYTDLNMVTIEGRVTRDAEYRAYQDEKGWCTFALANNIRAGKDNTHVNFFDCEIFGKRAAKLSKKLKRGVHVVITGTLKQRTWESNGKQHSRVEIVVMEIKPIGKFAPDEEVLSGENLVNKLKEDFDAEFGDETDIPF